MEFMYSIKSSQLISLNLKTDIRSSYYLEDFATELDIQDLELDWTCVCWDVDLRIENGE